LIFFSVIQNCNFSFGLVWFYNKKENFQANKNKKFP
jgi:hypothetical protein